MELARPSDEAEGIVADASLAVRNCSVGASTLGEGTLLVADELDPSVERGPGLVNNLIVYALGRKDTPVYPASGLQCAGASGSTANESGGARNAVDP